MTRRVAMFGAAFIGWGVLVVTSAAVGGARQTSDASQSSGAGWTVPAGAAAEKSPLTVSDAVLASGKKLFAGKCQRCHGAEGKGNGADADPKHQADMDLTAAARAARNPDGVVFYKIWNGRAKPKMPAQKNDLTKDQVWQIVSYAQTLRKKP